MHIAEYFESDHQRLDALFQAFQRLKAEDAPRSQIHLQEFSEGLRRHIAWEEEILFPLFEQRTGLVSRGPTLVMRDEHRHIIKHLDAIVSKIASGNIDSVYDEQMMLNILALHNQKEERILYPSIDRAMSDEERSGVFAAMEKLKHSRK